MGTKRTYPPPSLGEALAWVERPMHERVFCRLVLHPLMRTGELFVSVELGLRTVKGGEIICRRYGEKVRIGPIEVVQGALFRACMNAGLWLDEKTPEDIFKLFLWETGQK